MKSLLSPLMRQILSNEESAKQLQAFIVDKTHSGIINHNGQQYKIRFINPSLEKKI